MAELTIRMASNLIGYTFAEVTVPVHDDITPEEIARRHWEVNLRFLAEQDKIANEPVTEEQEKSIVTEVVKTLIEEMPATVIEETKTEAPWDAAPKAADPKPWQQKPKFENIPDLFA